MRNDRNMGLNYTLNRCLDQADTEYIARMDGDDISLPHRFETEINFLDAHPEYAVVSGPMIYFDADGDFRTGTGKGEVKKEDFILGSPVCHAPCMARTDAFKAVGGYSVGDKFLRAEDYHLWFKLFAAGFKLYMLNDVIYKMRDDRNALNRRTFKCRKNIAYVMHTGFRMIGLPWYTHVFAFKPILMYFVPASIYKWLHSR